MFNFKEKKNNHDDLIIIWYNNYKFSIPIHPPQSHETEFSLSFLIRTTEYHNPIGRIYLPSALLFPPPLSAVIGVAFPPPPPLKKNQ